ncbi:MAG: glycosyltransferase family 4 protein [Caldilineaceae bacterium]|nr:glycosyltransferase family 4 protein [Caldilineaceae bacterium]
MHVAFVTGEYPPMEGGVGAYTRALAQALAAQGVRVSVITSLLGAPDDGMPDDGVAVHPVVDGWGWSMIGRVRARAGELDVDWLHVQYQTAAFNMHPAINVAPIWWRRAGVHVAWTYHDLRVPYLFPKAGERLRHRVTTLPARTADLTVVTNEGDRLGLQNQPVRRLERIAIGSNITGVTLTPAERAARRQQHGYGAADQVIGYFGFLNRSKGGLTLIRTLDRLVATHPHVKLLMIGERVGASDPSNFAYLQEVEALIAARGLEARVQWTGRQSDAEVAADLNACDVLLMPYEDGASLRRGTLMAGLVNGCAIVTTTPQSPLPELAMERDVMYVAPANDEAAARAVARVLDNPWLAETLRTNARARARLFTWKGIAAAHVAAYTAAT